VSPVCNSAAALKDVCITAKTSGDSSGRVSVIICAMIQESFTTQRLPEVGRERAVSRAREAAIAGLKLSSADGVNLLSRGGNECLTRYSVMTPS
jgi:hypothetical protein